MQKYVLEGCILTKYCDFKGSYDGIETTYTCPNGKKGDSGNTPGGTAPAEGENEPREALLFNLNDIYGTDTYSHKLDINPNTDILIAGKENVIGKEGY